MPRETKELFGGSASLEAKKEAVGAAEDSLERALLRGIAGAGMEKRRRKLATNRSQSNAAGDHSCKDDTNLT